MGQPARSRRLARGCGGLGHRVLGVGVAFEQVRLGQPGFDGCRIRQCPVRTRRPAFADDDRAATERSRGLECVFVGVIVADHPWHASREWRWRIGGSDNDHGLPLQRQFRAMLQSQRRDGGNEYAQVNVNSAGHDDRILRGHGILRTPPGWNGFYERSGARKGNWELYGSVGLNRGGIGEDRGLGYNVQFRPTWFVSDAFNVFAVVYAERTPQWIVWQRDNLLGTFDERVLELDAGVNWTIGDRQELRVKLQAIGLDARLRQAWRTDADGTPVPVDEDVEDFSLRNLGFQVRYRYELAPLSDLYVVYGRGGYRYDAFGRDPAGQLFDAFSLRDSEQLLVKLSYRFEL